MKQEPTQKSPLALREEAILAFWRERGIFKKTLEKEAPHGEFVFFEGPPTANGKPGIHHLEARAFKDAIPRYKTMRGFHVRRKGGWDTHGLPVELQVEKELGLKSKKEIEKYGIAAFNRKCRESVWAYLSLWRTFTERIGYWVDIDDAYATYKAPYVESLWAIMKRVHEQKLLYKDYKVVPWCPRCGTGLSSHELAQGYEMVKDLAVTVAFKLKNAVQFGLPADTHILAWTTTPWTLPGNVGLAVGEKIAYVLVHTEGKGNFLIARERADKVLHGGVVGDREWSGKDLVGLEYEPLYPFLKDAISGPEKEKLPHAFKVYAADFVTTTDGTGVVHTAVMYGQDDFELGSKVGLPKYHLVQEDGTFSNETGFLAGKFVKDEAVAVEIIKDLAHRGLLFHKEKYEHSYPHCWRCKTPLIYYARDSWYIKMSALRDTLVKENAGIAWEPNYIKNGRFGEWLSEVKDWAISRERYWGTPLPVWECSSCKRHEVLGSFDEIRQKTGRITKLVFIRHGESEKNVKNILSSDVTKHPLTKQGEAQACETARKLAGMSLDAFYASPVLRARQTAELVDSFIGKNIIFDERLTEIKSGSWEEKRFDDPVVAAEQEAQQRLPEKEFYEMIRGKTGESWKQVEERMIDFTKDVIARHPGGTVAVVSHEGPIAFLVRHLTDVPIDDMKGPVKSLLTNGYGVPKVVYVDNLTMKEWDPHRPFVDDVTFSCGCGGTMRRAKEVMDVWFDSGAMPFAQDHYPFENAARVEGKGYPADFISEAIDQTRGWFYTLHAVGALMGRGKAYRNVICLGHILDANGKKMSKSLGNIVDPHQMIDKYGVDTLRLWMYSVNQPGESKNFDEKTVDEIVKKIFNLLSNVHAFYALYADDTIPATTSSHVLDRWVISRTHHLIATVTEHLDAYQLFEPVRAIREFVGDLSQWYTRRSRDRFKGSDAADRAQALATMRYVLRTIAEVMAPFAPFYAEDLFQKVRTENDAESVHLALWPQADFVDEKLLKHMERVRAIVSLGLEARAKSGIKVRQPLASLAIREAIPHELLPLIVDEVNVKTVAIDPNLAGDVSLDVTMTDALRQEGVVRELIRMIQESRKVAGLSPTDEAILVVATDKTGEMFIDANKDALTTATKLARIRFEEKVSGEAVVIDTMAFAVTVERA